MLDAMVTASVKERVQLFDQLCAFMCLQIDNVVSIQKKTLGLALSVILTLRLPQVLDKLDQILR